MLFLAAGHGLDDLVVVVIGCLGVTRAMELRCAGRQLLELVSHEMLLRVTMYATGWLDACCPEVPGSCLSDRVRTGCPTRASQAAAADRWQFLPAPAFLGLPPLILSPAKAQAKPASEDALETLAEAVLATSMRGGSVSEPNVHGQTALMWAAGHGCAPLCALLIASGASLEAVDSGGWTALFRAVWHGQESATAVLLRAGADVNTHKARYTPLMAAARFGHGRLVQDLLAARADPSPAMPPFGETALCLAKAQGHRPVVELLAGSGLGTAN